MPCMALSVGIGRPLGPLTPNERPHVAATADPRPPSVESRQRPGELLDATLVVVLDEERTYMTASQPRDAESSTLSQAPLLEFVTIPGCADCRRFERLLERVMPDFPEIEVREVAGETSRGMAISVERGALRFPVIVLDDEVIAIESITESDLRTALSVRRDRR